MTGSPDVTPGLVALAQGAAMQQQINFTRMEEHEADRVGIGYLAAAGFDPNGMAGLFRIDDAPARLGRGCRARAAADPPRGHRAHRRGARPRRDRCPLPAASGFRELLADTRAAARDHGSAPKRTCARYYERLRANDPEQPVAGLRAGAGGNEVRHREECRRHPASHWLPRIRTCHCCRPRSARRSWPLADGDAALATFERGLEISPRNVPLTVRYAEALLDLDKPKKAHMLLLDLFNNVTPTPEQIKLTALAASAAGDTGDAYYYMSEFIGSA